jgi:ankyrin repeat protein
MRAVHKNQAGAARVLVEGGAEVDARGPHEETALMMAAGYGQEETVRLLLEAGADPGRKEVHGLAALDKAVMGVIDIHAVTVGRRQTGTVKALLDHAPGLSVNARAWGNMGRMVKRLAGCEEVVRLVEQRRASQ